jgi:hypothetical protein
MRGFVARALSRPHPPEGGHRPPTIGTLLILKTETLRPCASALKFSERCGEMRRRFSGLDSFGPRMRGFVACAAASIGTLLVLKTQTLRRCVSALKFSDWHALFLDFMPMTMASSCEGDEYGKEDCG